MKTYLELLNHVLNHGTEKSDRTGTGTRSVFGCQMRFNLQDGFPLLTTKKVHFKSVAYELLWFLRGDTNIAFLKENGVSIWDEWADSDGNLGPVYGKQWRNWNGCDQIETALQQLRNDPDSRRILVSAWNVSDLPEMALYPCHVLFQFYVSTGKLSCQLYQRSADVFLGVPFNIAGYALLIHLMAQQSGLQPGELIWTGGDVHLYNNHLHQAKEQLSRSPYPLPTLEVCQRASINDYCFEDFKLNHYQHHPAIKAPVAV